MLQQQQQQQQQQQPLELDSSRRPTLANANLMAMQRNRNAQPVASNNNNITSEGNSRITKRNSMQSSEIYMPINVTYTQPPPQIQVQVKLENTYSLGPNDNQKFNVSRIQRLANDILTQYLQNLKYDPHKCKEMVQILSDEIKNRVKSIIYKRYKVIVQISIGQAGQGILIASRSLWNPEIDNSCSVQFSNNSIYAVATIYAIYFD